MTYREFAEKYLEGKVREQYVANIKKLNGVNYIDHELNIEIPNSIFFITAFHWAQSPEGHDYWAKIYDDFQKKVKPRSKEKTYTVHFLTPYYSWEDVKARSKKEAIKKCNLPYEAGPDSYGQFVAIEEE